MIFPSKAFICKAFPIFSSLITSQGSRQGSRHRKRCRQVFRDGIAENFTAGVLQSQGLVIEDHHGFFCLGDPKKHSEVSVRICLMAEG